MDFENRIVTPEYTGADAETEFSLRPRTLAEYIGQDKAKDMIRAGLRKLSRNL